MQFKLWSLNEENENRFTMFTCVKVPKRGGATIRGMYFVLCHIGNTYKFRKIEVIPEYSTHVSRTNCFNRIPFQVNLLNYCVNLKLQATK